MPPTKLDRILDKLDPDRIAAVIGNTHDMARESFKLTSNTVDNYPQFHDLVIRYYRHHYAQVFGGGEFLDDDRAHWEVKGVIDNAYKESGGFEGAYQNARTGKAGGMHGVLGAISGNLKQEQERQYVEYVFYTETDPYDYESLVSLMAEILDRFGYLLPPGYRGRSPNDLARNFDTIVKHLSRSISAVRDLLRHY